jgi:DNA-binding response OmpR family regulator
MRVLVVEDEPEMGALISRGLREQGYAVDMALDGMRALYLADISDYDLVLLDARLPKVDGFTVCRELRQRTFNASILMLTALDAPQDIIRGLNCGADDYLSKPFDFRVLLARMRALLRRPKQVRPDVVQVGDLILDTSSHTARRGERSISLTAKEYALLELFMLRQGQLLGRAEIAEHVWDEHFDPMSNVIDVYVNRLRKKVDLGFSQQLLHTRRSEGYLMSSELQG